MFETRNYVVESFSSKVMKIVCLFDHLYDDDELMMMVTMNLMRMKMAYLRTWHAIVMATSHIDGTGFILNNILFSSGRL